LKDDEEYLCTKVFNQKENVKKRWRKRRKKINSIKYIVMGDKITAHRGASFTNPVSFFV
jgi:hypothetical protein